MIHMVLLIALSRDQATFVPSWLLLRRPWFLIVSWQVSFPSLHKTTFLLSGYLNQLTEKQKGHKH